jgi:hypothetical protein
MTLVSAVACCLLLSLGTATQPLMQRWNDVYKHLNSKTPYTAEQQGEGEDAERELRALLSDGRQGAPDTGTCDEVALYGVLRHGSRYPQRKQVAKLEKLRERLRFSAAAQQDPDLACVKPRTVLLPSRMSGGVHAYEFACVRACTCACVRTCACAGGCGAGIRQSCTLPMRTAHCTPPAEQS